MCVRVRSCSHVGFVAARQGELDNRRCATTLGRRPLQLRPLSRCPELSTWPDPAPRRSTTTSTQLP